MKISNKKVRFFSSAFMCVFLFACAESSPREKKEDKKDEPQEEVTETETESMDMQDETSFMLPSPIQIAAIFNRAGLGYQNGLTNPPSNVSKYNTKTAKYLNFGIYSADLAYVVLNKKQQESIDYLKTIKDLSEAIDMPSIFESGTLINKFEKNINNQDSILAILTTIKSRTDECLSENFDESKEAVFFSSAWLEGMYLGANSAESMQKVTPRLIEQMTILDNTIQALKMQSDESLELGFLINGLEDLRSTFNGFAGVKKMKEENTDFEGINLTKEELNTITQKITDLRTKIVNG